MVTQSRRRLRVFVILAIVGCLADVARGQDRLFTSAGPGATPAEVGAIGHFGRNLGGRPAWVLGMLVDGGHFVIEERGATLPLGGTERSPIVRTTDTGALVALPTGYLLAADPIRPRVFLLRGADVVMVHLAANTSTTLTTALPLPLRVGAFPVMSPPEAQFAQNAELLFVRRRNAAGDAGELAVVDVNAGLLRRLLPNPSSRHFGFSLTVDPQWLVDPDATRVFGHNGTSVTVMDAGSGAIIATRPVATSVIDLFGNVPFSGLMADWSNHRVLAVQGSPSQWTLSVLQTSGAMVVELPQGGYCMPQWRVSPHTGRGYLLFNTGGGGKYYGPIFTSLLAFDAETLSVHASADITSAFGFSTDLCNGLALALATAPGPPANLSATVTARDVRFTWTNVGDASGFVLDAGLAPGTTALTVPVGPTPSVTFRDVPPGRYYIRVRGGNAMGGGRPSNEVAVVVP